VVGLAASGTSRMFWPRCGSQTNAVAATIGVTSNPRSPLARAVDIAIAPDTGPEAIAGSTRLKAGTAQKMVLNLLSTASMVRLGRVYENWMIYVALTNQKLRQRGARISRRSFRRERVKRATSTASIATRFARCSRDAKDWRKHTRRAPTVAAIRRQRAASARIAKKQTASRNTQGK